MVLAETDGGRLTLHLNTAGVRVRIFKSPMKRKRRVIEYKADGWMDGYYAQMERYIYI